jgi:hypothetical protein
MRGFHLGTGRYGLLKALLSILLVDATVIALLCALRVSPGALHAVVVSVIVLALFGPLLVRFD